MNDVRIHRHHNIHVYERPYVIGMKEGKYRKYDMYKYVHET